MTEKRELKIGIAGKRGESFIAGFRSLPEVEVAAFCELDPVALARIADQHDIEHGYTDYTDLVADDLDAIGVATTMQLHVPQAVLALGQGKHVLSEVTAATSLEQCADLVAAVRASGRTYMMAENYCYTPQSVLVSALAEAGLFGDIYYAEGAYIHDCHFVQYDNAGRPTWRVTWQVGRNGCTYGTHSLGPVLEWLGQRVATVSCLGSGIHTVPAHQLDDTVTMLCKLTNGALANIRLDMQSHRPHNMTHYALQGTRGAYQSARRAGELDLVWIEGRSPDRETWQSLDEYADEFLPDWYQSTADTAQRSGHGGGDYFVARAFARSILDGTPPPIDVYRALDFTVPGLVSEESIGRGGTPVAVPDFRSFAPRAG